MQRAWRVAIPLCGVSSTTTPPALWAAASANSIPNIIAILPKARTPAPSPSLPEPCLRGADCGSFAQLLRRPDADDRAVRGRLGQRRQFDALALGLAARLGE